MPTSSIPEAGSRSIKSMIKAPVQVGFEAFWGVGFRLAGAVRRPRAAAWSSPGGQNVLVVAPHPDDEVAGCAGTILLHRRAGDRVLVVFVTDGRASTAFGMSPDDMAATRRREARDAIRVLGVEEAWLALPERAWEDAALRSALGKILEDYVPHVVYAPSRIDFHPDHERVARVIAPILGDPVVRAFPVQVPLTPVLCNLISPLGAAAEPASKAMRCYPSQWGTLERCLRHRRHLGRLYGWGGPAEEFWQMTADTYRRLHGERPDRPLAEIFRGLRYYAWSDPLSYLGARTERRRLARHARGEHG